MFFFFLLIILIYTLIHFTIYHEITTIFPKKGGIYYFIIILCSFLYCSFFLAEFLKRSNIYHKFKIIVFIGEIWIGIACMLFFLFLINIPIKVIVRSEKYSFYSNSIILFIVFVLTLYGYINFRRGPIKKFIELNYLSNIEGLKIIQLSDLHLTLVTDTEYIKKIVEMINNENPDIVVITGDLIDSKLRDDQIKIFRLIKSRFGTFIVPGNHEYYAGFLEFKRILNQLGFTLILNDSIRIKENLCIAGIDDKTGIRFNNEGPNIVKSLSNCRENDFIIFLTHSPSLIDEQIEKRANLILAGHTHNGQIPPINIVVKFLYKYSYGLYKFSNRYIYVTSGTGIWGPPLRLFSKSEIVTFKLKRIR